MTISFSQTNTKHTRTLNHFDTLGSLFAKESFFLYIKKSATQEITISNIEFPLTNLNKLWQHITLKKLRRIFSVMNLKRF